MSITKRAYALISAPIVNRDDALRQTMMLANIAAEKYASEKSKSAAYALLALTNHVRELVNT